MKKNKIIAAMMFVAIAVSVKAQQLTPMQLKEARMAAYGWMNDYNLYARLEERRDPEQKFYNLFESDTIKIANDYLPSISEVGHRITLKDMARYIMDPDRIYDMYFSISKAKIVNESYKNGVLYFDMCFSKNVEFSEKDNYSDTVFAYPQLAFLMTARLKYDFKNRQIVAVSLEADTVIDKLLLLHDANHVPVNSYTTSELIERESKTRSTPLILLSYQRLEMDKQFIRMHSDTIKNDFHFGVSVGAIVPVIAQSTLSAQTGVYYDFYIGYYRQLYLKKNDRVGLEINAAFASRNLSFSGDYDEEYNSVDADGGLYERRINVTGFNERIGRYSVEIPLSIRYDRMLKKNLSVFFKAGASVSYDILQKSNVSATATEYSGYYDWLFDVVLDQNGIYDFGTFENEKSESTEIGLDNLGINVFAGVGIHHFLKKNISLEYSLQYKNMVYNKTRKSENVSHITDHSGDWNSATFFLNTLNMQNICFNIQMNINF